MSFVSFRCLSFKGLSWALSECQLRTVPHNRRLLPLLEMPSCAVCGNQRCELGEACSEQDTSMAAVVHAFDGGAVTTNATTSSNSSMCCLADCPVVVRSCPVDTRSGLACSGHGSCLTGVGVCRCFDGYGGDVCSTCSGQYETVADTNGGVVRCVLLAGMYSTCFNGVCDGLEQGVDCGGVCPGCGATPSGADTAAGGQTVLIAATTVVGALSVVTVVAVVLARHRNQQHLRRTSIVISQLGGSPRRARGSIQPSAVCPVGIDAVDYRRRSSIGDRVARILGRNSIDGGTVGVDVGRRGSGGGGRGGVGVGVGEGHPGSPVARGHNKQSTAAPTSVTGGYGAAPGVGVGARRSSAVTAAVGGGPLSISRDAGSTLDRHPAATGVPKAATLTVPAPLRRVVNVQPAESSKLASSSRRL